MNEYLFYPGCSLEGRARAYSDSLSAVSGQLGLELHEIPDWNCCGATEYLSIDTIPAYALITRNLALAAEAANGTREVLAACSACYLNLFKADHYLGKRHELREKVNEALSAGGLHYDPGSLVVHHLLDVIIHEIGLDAVRAGVVRPLAGLRVAPYLGCMLTRPDYAHRWSDAEHPTEFRELLAALGAEVVSFPLETACCGGHMTQIGPQTAYDLLHRLMQAAHDSEAHLMATVCPMCQMNIDAYQSETNRHFGEHITMPIVFFTQLMGLAFGLPAEQVGFGKELVSAGTALAQIGIETPKPAEVDRRRHKPEGLPMPKRLVKDMTKSNGRSREMHS
jgi:heterodisulfide reductase subunit B